MLPSNTILRKDQEAREREWRNRVQGGIAFPAGDQQASQWVVRLNLSKNCDANMARRGLSNLCEVLTEFQNQTHDMFFSVTLGFGYGFFDQLGILETRKPERLRPMPSDPSDLGDASPDVRGTSQYNLRQTDMIILLGAFERAVIRAILGAWPKRDDAPHYDKPTIVQAIEDWAEITEVHEGFRRSNKRNILGFIDGSSNPIRLSDLFHEVVWTREEADPKDPNDGTYLVFQKIAHDLDQWQSLGNYPTPSGHSLQEAYLGRHKVSGVMLGTQFDSGSSVNVLDEQPYVADQRLSDRLRSSDPQVKADAEQERERYFESQNDPSRLVFGVETGVMVVGDTVKGCPVWSHIRRANPRLPDSGITRIIYRRGCPFIEDGPPPQSGLLFLSFQRDIAHSFEFIKDQWLNPWREQVPEGIRQIDTGIFRTLGGGYYYIPPIPGGDLSHMVQQFFPRL